MPCVAYRQLATNFISIWRDLRDSAFDTSGGYDSRHGGAHGTLRQNQQK